jgi:hypothetical protein
VLGQASTTRSYDLKRGGAAGSASTSLVSLSYELDLWGRLSAQRSAADWELKATESDRQATALALVGTTAGLYWRTGYLNQRIALSEAGMEDGRRILALVRVKYAAGAVSGLDVAQAGQNLATQEAAHTQLLQQRVEARNALAILFDQPPEPMAVEPPRLPDIALPAIDAGVPARLLGRRPDLRAAEQRLRAALANVDATRTGFYPALSLTGSLGTSSSALGELLKNPVATLGAGLALPFLQWNTARLSVGVSQAQYEEAAGGFQAIAVHGAVGGGERAVVTHAVARRERKGRRSTNSSIRRSVHPGQQHVVAPVAEVRDAAFLGREVLDRRVDIDRLDAAPGEAHDGLGVEVEAAHPRLAPHHRDQVGDRVDAKAVERIADAGEQRLQVGPSVGHAPAAHAQQRRRLASNTGLPEHHGLGPRLRSACMKGDQVGRVLAVRIHRERMREARVSARRRSGPCSTAAPLPRLLGSMNHAQAGVVRGHLAQPFGRAVGAAVGDDPHRAPLARAARTVENRRSPVL